MKKNQKKFLLIDANSLIHRAYHALPPLTTKNGVLVNAVYGFSNILFKALKDIKPDYIAVCFDTPGGTFRDKIYTDYKAGREEKPEEFYKQFDIIKDILKNMNISICEKKLYEADDLIGTLSDKNKNNDIKNIVLSGDKDMLQLVNKNTAVLIAKKGVSETQEYNMDNFKQLTDLNSDQWIDYKALRGDPSDNIPGVKGIGEKTAINLLNEFHSLDNIYKQIENKNTKNTIKGKLLTNLTEQKDTAYLSKKLVTIEKKAPIDTNIENYKYGPIKFENIISIMRDLEFKSLLSKIQNMGNQNLFDGIENKKTIKSNEEWDEKYKKYSEKYMLITDDIDGFLSQLEKQKILAVDTETDSEKAVSAQIIGISFCFDKNQAYYLPYRLLNKTQKNKLKKILENEEIKKIGHNIKYDIEIFKTIDIDIKNIYFDTMIASYLTDPGERAYSLSSLAFTYLGKQMINIEELIGKKGDRQLSLKDIDEKKVAIYAAEDAHITYLLYHELKNNTRLKKVEKVFFNIEMPLVQVLADMEYTGVLIDKNFLSKLSNELDKKLKTIQKKIYKLSGEEFNILSPKQLKEILFEKLNISHKNLAKTKTGISTSATELEKIKNTHPIINLISEYRELSKLKNTYTDSIPKLINPKTKRVHTNYNQTITATGRLSSSHPNLQNIPVRTELGAKIRNAFIADKNFSIITADYSQIELRIAASISGDKNMIEIFKNDGDIHTITASQINNIPEDKVTPVQRRNAKEINFGILYGLGWRGVAQRTGIPLEEAKKFYEKYKQIYPKLIEYIETTKETVRKKKYTETLFGRRRYFPEIETSHQILKAQAERAAINHPIQGTQADIIKKAMIEISDKIKAEKLDKEIKIILQVHDELVFEVKDDKQKLAIEIITNIMENVCRLKVPLKINISSGKSWGECK